MFRWSGGSAGVFGKKLARKMPIIELEQQLHTGEDSEESGHPTIREDPKCEPVEIVTEDVVEEKKPKKLALDMDPFLAQLTKK